MLNNLELLREEVAKTGEIRKRKDGSWQKQKDGTWSKVKASPGKPAASAPKKPTAKPRGLTFASQAAFNAAALKAYEWITNNDPYPGAWPKQDTGSDSLSGCKWLVENGYAKGCQILSGASAALYDVT